MKKIITVLLACAISLFFTIPALAFDYEFSTGSETLAGFGRATSTDEPVSRDLITQNERRNKDAADLPPPYFYGSGDIPTGTSSLYHDNQPGSAAGSPGNNSAADPPPALVIQQSPPLAQNTTPLYYSDGSIGTLYVSRTGKTIKVYEGEQLSNLNKGAGHFPSTSAWDGNAAFCGHNRGSAGYFSFVKDMQTGDRVTYTTLYGTRIYEVFSKERIGENDRSKLGWSAENILTLITCIENVPDLRWVVQLREVR